MEKWSLLLVAILAVVWCVAATKRFCRGGRNGFEGLWAPVEKQRTTDMIQQPLEEQHRTKHTLVGNEQHVKDLYHKLQNLEDHHEALATARETLWEALDLAQQTAETTPKDGEITNVTEYSARVLKTWSDRQEALVTEDFTAYIQRRRSGGGRELLPTYPDGVAWLCQQGPLRCVDGAWLSRSSQVRSPWQYTGVVRHLWQILSEEYGDGDLKQHHTYIYQALLKTVVPGFPEAHTLEFLDPQYGANDFATWQDGLIQLLMSLFHEELLPELIGFNLHFEAPTLKMMIAAMEMKELGLDPSYFRLHVSIDNGASGHTAMARNAIDQYLRGVEDTRGAIAAQAEWKRIQVGYLLSKGAFRRKASASKDLELVEKERLVAEIFSSKAIAAQAAHCASRAKLNGRSLQEWLDPQQMKNPDWREALVRGLASSRYWISPGDPGNSRFFKELLWGGRMFGAFTEAECTVISRWIELMAFDGSLQPVKTKSCSRGTGIRFKSSIHRSSPAEIDDLRRLIMSGIPAQRVYSLHYTIHLDVRKWGLLLPAIWILHFCLLEQCIAIPSKSATELGCTIIRILRAEWGFRSLHYSVAGTDLGADNKGCAKSPPMTDVTSRVLAQYDHPSVNSLEDILKLHADDSLPAVMLQLSNAPDRCKGLLLGMASAFVSLYHALADSEIVTTEMATSLRKTAEIKEQELSHCQELLRADNSQYREYCQGFHWVRKQLSA